MSLQRAIPIPLKSVLSNLVPLEEEAWHDFAAKGTERTYDKNEMLWRSGEICRYLVFLKRGLVRSFEIKEGKEFTMDFYDSNSLFYDDHSFLAQKPMRKNYQILEKSEILLIPRAHLLSMYDQYKCFERLGRISVERAHIRMIEARERLTQNAAENNYKYLLTHQPWLIQLLPQKIIASYLHISTEHLSRIRLKISAQ